MRNIKNALIFHSFLSLFLLSACKGSDESTDHNIVIIDPTQQQEVEETSSLGNITDPLPLGKMITTNAVILGGEYDVTIARLNLTLQEVIRGQEALDIIIGENQQNKMPDEGMEYALVKVQGKLYDAVSDSDIFVLNQYDFKFIGKDGRDNDVIKLDVPDYLYAEMNDEDTVEGWLYNEVKIGEEFKISYETSEGTYIYFKTQ